MGETTTSDRPLGGAEVRPGSGAMFDRIAGRYDVINRLLSLGLDQSWRRRAIRALELPSGARVLDVATGTADVALEISGLHGDATVVGVDPSPGMLEIGREKVAAAGRAECIELRLGEAEDLPFDDATFDGVTIAWGIRNTADRAKALAEMGRVTKPGGRVAILESLEARGGVLAPFVRFYCRTVVPAVGAVLSRGREYRYLQRSIAEFPAQDAFQRMMDDAGLEVTFSKPLTFGACHLFVGRRISSETEGSAS